MSANETQVGGTHYLNMGIEPWDVVDTWPLEQRIGYYRGGALKYLMRLGSKDAGAQEARKAGHYCQKLAEVLEAGAGRTAHNVVVLGQDDIDYLKQLRTSSQEAGAGIGAFVPPN